MKPWRPLEEMDHDELRRYTHELLQRWQMAPPNQRELSSYIEAAAVHMEKLGLDSPRGRLAHAGCKE